MTPHLSTVKKNNRDDLNNIASTTKFQVENVSCAVKEFDDGNEIIEIKDSTKTMEFLNHIEEMKSMSTMQVYGTSIKENHRFFGVFFKDAGYS